MHKLLFTTLLLFGIFLSGCVSIENKYSALPPGIWRATLRLDQNLPDAAELVESSKENMNFIELPFNFEIKYNEDQSFYLELINGTERIKVDDISYGIDKKTAKDTVIINFPIYDTYIKAIYEEGIMEGNWYVNYKENYAIPFKAYHGQDNRFPISNADPNAAVAGRWETSFDYNKSDPWPAIGEFELEGKKLTGTFRTETGDFRYLEGINYGDKVSLSCFDGSHAFLFESKILPDSSMVGKFYSGKHYISDWIAKKNENATLTSVYELTKPVSDEPFAFELENAAGELVSLDSPKYRGKSKIIQITGSWCPNCRDESKFLKAIEKDLPPDIEIIAIAFEKYRAKDKAWVAINRYRDKMDLPYEFLLGGYSNKSEASLVFPTLNKVISYPTLIFLNKKNEILKIHTGFNGPATDQYDEFVKDFNNMVKALSSDKE